MDSPRVVSSTERLIVRELLDEDLDALATMLVDPEVSRHLGDGQPWSRARTARHLAEWRQGYERSAAAMWATVRRQDGRLIGRCGLLHWDFDDTHHLEVSYLLARPFWGQGYATEAACAIRDHAFGRFPIGQLISLVKPANLPSAAVAKRMGMQLASRRVVEGAVYDVYRIDRRDWRPEAT